MRSIIIYLFLRWKDFLRFITHSQRGGASSLPMIIAIGMCMGAVGTSMMFRLQNRQTKTQTTKWIKAREVLFDRIVQNMRSNLNLYSSSLHTGGLIKNTNGIDNVTGLDNKLARCFWARGSSDCVNGQMQPFTLRLQNNVQVSNPWPNYIHGTDRVEMLNAFNLIRNNSAITYNDNLEICTGVDGTTKGLQADKCPLEVYTAFIPRCLFPASATCDVADQVELYLVVGQSREITAANMGKDAKGLPSYFFNNSNPNSNYTYNANFGAEWSMTSDKYKKMYNIKLNVRDVINQGAQSCPVGQVVKRITADGKLKCGFKVNPCPVPGTILIGQKPDGSPLCEEALKAANCPPGWAIGHDASTNNVGIDAATGQWSCFRPYKGNSCSGGVNQAIVGFDDKGNPKCNSFLPDKGKSCPAGELFSGSFKNGDPVCIKPLQNSTPCKGKDVMVGIDSEGKPVCKPLKFANQGCTNNTLSAYKDYTKKYCRGSGQQATIKNESQNCKNYLFIELCDVTTTRIAPPKTAPVCDSPTGSGNVGITGFEKDGVAICISPQQQCPPGYVLKGFENGNMKCSHISIEDIDMGIM